MTDWVLMHKALTCLLMSSEQGFLHDYCVETETAENIGYSCNMLREEMEVFIVGANSAEGVKEELQ